MPEAEGLTTQLYEDPAGRSAVRDFLDRLEARDRARVQKKLEMIRFQRAERLRDEWLRRHEWGSA